MLPWSVIPIAGCPSATALATISSRRAAPSSIENSVWTWRWVNESVTEQMQDSVCQTTSMWFRRPYQSGGALQIRAGAVLLAGHLAAGAHLRHGAGRELPELVELLAGGQLLREQRRLDPVEQALEPAHELGLGDAQLGVGRHVVDLERQRQ